MSYIHELFTGGRNAVITVELNKQANVYLLDQLNYSAFRRGARFKHFGGRQVQTVAQFSPPRHAHWHVVVVPDPGSSVRASISVDAA